MSKTLTGRNFSQKEFNLLNQCVECGIADDYINFNSKCKACEELDLKKCTVCDALLRDGSHISYTYDMGEEYANSMKSYRGYGSTNRLVREFVFLREQLYPKHDETICEECINFHEKIKDRCYNCERNFANSVDHYKKHGNLCTDCVKLF